LSPFNTRLWPGFSTWEAWPSYFPRKKTSIAANIILALAVLILSGCATVTRGTKDTLVIESDPAGAEVRLSTGQTGRTPTSFKLKRKEPVVVTITREGYETVNVNVNAQVVGAGAAGMAGNVLVGGIIGVGVDAWSGATKSLKPNPVTVKLVKLEPKMEAAAPVASTPVAPTAPAPTASAMPAAVTPAATTDTADTASTIPAQVEASSAPAAE
jgi:hypothetical protein